MSVIAPPPTRVLKVACIGNPNAGKSTLFNALAGLRARVANYPGVTVEKKVGRVTWDSHAVDLIDLPGTYSISPRSPDELVSVDVLLGQQPDVGPIDAVLCIADASNLERHLYLVSQVLDLGLPVVLVLNMWDAAAQQGLEIDVAKLSRRLRIPVVVTEAHRRKGIEKIGPALLQAIRDGAPAHESVLPAPFQFESRALAPFLRELGFTDVAPYLCDRLLLDSGGSLEQRFLDQTNGELTKRLTASRERLAAVDCHVGFLEVNHRYRWVRGVMQDVVAAPTIRRTAWTDRIDAWLTHRATGLVLFAGLMFLVFQALYTWATPLMDACEAIQGWCGAQVVRAMSPGPLRSLIVDGVIAGVGSVLIFVPQIALLFLFIAILEDCGYMARAAYMMDRVMALMGLSGRSFLPLMSSFACAVPGIMATRVIDSRRERMVTILIAPLMSCSARLPVYLLLIAAFVPATLLWGWLSVQGLVLFAMSSLGLIVAIPVAWMLRKTFFRGESGTFVMELPAYKRPSVRLVAYRVYERSLAFVARAGTLIFATTILVWAAGYFPGDRTRLDRIDAELETLSDMNPAQAGRIETLTAERNTEAAKLIRGSYLGRVGRAIEPAVKPLGWDWRIGVGVLASFPAREVIISTLGTIYSLGGDVDEESAGLTDALRRAQWPDGRPVYTLPVALSLMVFFALCAQCASTLVIMRRETNSWRWPVFSFGYMTLLAYLGALVTYRAGAWWLG